MRNICIALSKQLANMDYRASWEVDEENESADFRIVDNHDGEVIRCTITKKQVAMGQLYGRNPIVTLAESMVQEQ
jgi:hypothetical protein